MWLYIDLFGHVDVLFGVRHFCAHCLRGQTRLILWLRNISCVFRERGNPIDYVHAFGSMAFLRFIAVRGNTWSACERTDEQQQQCASSLVPVRQCNIIELRCIIPGSVNSAADAIHCLSQWYMYRLWYLPVLLYQYWSCTLWFMFRPSYELNRKTRHNEVIWCQMKIHKYNQFTSGFNWCA